jgi:hypothetical protein
MGGATTPVYDMPEHMSSRCFPMFITVLAGPSSVAQFMLAKVPQGKRIASSEHVVHLLAGVSVAFARSSKDLFSWRALDCSRSVC